MALVDIGVHEDTTEGLMESVRRLEDAVAGLQAENERLRTEIAGLRRAFELVRTAGTIMAMAPGLVWGERPPTPHLGHGKG